MFYTIFLYTLYVSYTTLCQVSTRPALVYSMTYLPNSAAEGIAGECDCDAVSPSVLERGHTINSSVVEQEFGYIMGRERLSSSCVSITSIIHCT